MLIIVAYGQLSRGSDGHRAAVLARADEFMLQPSNFDLATQERFPLFLFFRKFKWNLKRL